MILLFPYSTIYQCIMVSPVDRTQVNHPMHPSLSCSVRFRKSLIRKRVTVVCPQMANRIPEGTIWLEMAMPSMSSRFPRTIHNLGCKNITLTKNIWSLLCRMGNENSVK